MTAETKNALKSVVNSFIVGVNDADSLLDKEAIMKQMKKIIEEEGGYQITAPKEGAKVQRWTSYVKDITRPNGRRKISKATEKELLAFLWDFYNLGLKTKKLLFKDLWVEFITYKWKFVNVENDSKALSPSTLCRYEREYGNYIAGSALDTCDVTSVTVTNLEAYISDVIKNNQMLESCASNVYGYITQALDYAYRSEYTQKHYSSLLDKKLILAQAIPDKKEEDGARVLTKLEIEALMKRLLERRKSKRNRTYMPDYAIMLAIMTGMRVGELAVLKWKDIEDKYILIRHSEKRLDYKGKTCEYIIGNVKNNVPRKFPITEEIQTLLEDIKALGLKNEEGFIFWNEKEGKRYMAHDISCAIERRSKEAGIQKASIHEIRRTVSSELRKRMPVKVVANLLGHLEDTNELFYNYDNMEVDNKIACISDYLSDYSNLLNVEDLLEHKKITEALILSRIPATFSK